MHHHHSASPCCIERETSLRLQPGEPAECTLYVGVTSELAQRGALHKQDLIAGFTKKYRVHLLVYHETHPTMEAAMRRQKQIKEWRRLWKIRLIESMNPEWVDLFDDNSSGVFEGPADMARRTR